MDPTVHRSAPFRTRELPPGGLSAPARFGIIAAMATIPSLFGRALSLLLTVGSVTLAFTAPAPVRAQTGPLLTWGGEIRPRILAREPVGGEWDHWISMRSRVQLHARFEGGLGLFLQVQDVRYWGEELSNRDKTADAVDFHQAYLEVDDLPGLGGLIRAGRQEVTVADGRFLAAPNWGQAGQTFDGARWIRPLGKAKLEMVYLRLQEGSAEPHEVSADLTSAWLAVPAGDAGSIDLLFFHDRSGDPDRNGPLGKGRQSTAGAIWKKKAGSVSLRAQAMGQFGDRLGTDVSASMFSVSGTAEVLEGKGTFTLWFDQLSGDDDRDDGEAGAFSTLFGARHRYYGRGDYFKDIPEDTGGLGLRDGAVKLSYAPSPLLSVNLDLHTFSTHRQGDLSGRHLAEAADVWLRYRFREAMELETGASLTWAHEAMEELGLLEGTGSLGYFMVSLAF